MGLRDKKLAVPSLPALFSLVTVPTFTLVTPKWIFPAVMLSFRLVCGSNTFLLGINPWPGISKKHLNINMSRTEGLIPCPDHKNDISMSTTTIFSQYMAPPSPHLFKPKTCIILDSFASLSTRSASPGVSFQKTYI